MFVLTERILALLGSLVGAVAALLAPRRMNFRLDLRLDAFSPLAVARLLLELPGSLASSRRTVVDFVAETGGLNHLSGNS